MYLTTSLRDPGAIKSLKLIRTPGIHSTEPQSIDFSNHSPLTEVASQKKFPEKISESKEIEDENSGPISISALGKNAIVNDSDEEQEPPVKVSVEVNQVQEESTINIEIRYCPICLIEQPLRAKHCKECNVCVAVYDHHCPWMGNCVGERNRFNFWWYLACETCMLNWTLVILCQSIESKDEFLSWIQSNLLLAIGIFITGFFSIMVSFLLVFHAYLAGSNKTTWEQLSWEKISYLSKWPKHLGSPFTKGLIKNIQHYCCKPLPKGYTIWIYPSKLPG